MSDEQEKADLAELLERPGFHRFVLRSIQMAGIFSPATNGSDSRNLDHAEGRRSLGLDILRDAARGIPVDDPQAAFHLLLIQTLREGAQQTPEEKPRGRRRSDQYRDLDDGDGDASGG